MSKPIVTPMSDEPLMEEFITDSLTGILKEEFSVCDVREEELREKYGFGERQLID